MWPFCAESAVKHQPTDPSVLCVCVLLVKIVI